jgi:hypothetical protein
MKTFKIVTSLFILSALIFNNINAQKPERVVLTQPASLYIACMGQLLSGELVFERNFMNNHFQAKVSGILTGEDGLEYTVDLVNSFTSMDWSTINWEDWEHNAINYIQVQNMLLRLDGKLVAKIHLTFHFNFNANGELVVADMLNYIVDCK